MSMEIRYGLMHKDTGEWVQYYSLQNEGIYAESQSYYLTEKSHEGIDIWLVDSLEQAVYAKWVSTEWYNAQYETPVNPLHVSDLVVAKYITFSVPKEITIVEEERMVNEMLEKQGYAKLDRSYVAEALPKAEGEDD